MAQTCLYVVSALRFETSLLGKGLAASSQHTITFDVVKAQGSEVSVCVIIARLLM